MRSFLKRLASDDTGATAIEYGLIAALISVGIITAVGLIGDDIATAFQYIADELPDAPPS